MEIDSSIPPDQYHLDKYREATPYLFQLEDPSSLQNISKINKKIATYNVKNKKPKMGFFIPLETIEQTMRVYEQAKSDKDEVKMNGLAETWQAQVKRDTFPKE